MNNNSLEGKVFLITGAAGGFGSAAAARCARDGARLVLSDVREKELHDTVASVCAAGGQAMAVVADTRSEADCDRAVAETLKKFGRIDGVFANAGEVWIAPALEQGKSFWDDCLALELTGQWLAAKAALPAMIEQQSGSIVFSSSMTGNMGVEKIAAYSAAKAGLQALVKTLTAEMSRYGIRFNTIASGSVRSRHTLVSNARRANVSVEQAELTFEQEAKDRGTMFPLGRMGVPEDIAHAVRYLLSDESEWVTGTTMFIDGGLSGWLTRRGKAK